MSKPHVTEIESTVYEVQGPHLYFANKGQAYETAARMIIFKAGVRCKYDIKQIKRLKARLARYLAFVDSRRGE